MTWSNTAIGDYLYGYRYKPIFDANNTMSTVPIPINTHEWKGKKIHSGEAMAYSDAWRGKKNNFGSETACTGVRLRCLRKLLRTVLTKQNSDLVILIKLQRYEEGFGDKKCRFSYTIAVIRIKRNLNFEFYKGAVNKINETKN